MGRIKVLGDSLANKIAAGEVVERPASVVKELVENSIDAHATDIRITIKQGGKELIQIEDNGEGIGSDDVLLAFERHATSKLDSLEGLFSISTLGFRGEALPSIASVSKLTLITKTRHETAGSLVEISGGKLVNHQPIGAREGTSVIVRQLFFNTPARYKFLKQDASERRYILDTVIQLAMANPHIRFTLIADDKELFKSPGDGNLLSVIMAAYGRSVAGAMVSVEREKNFVRVFGYVSKPSLHRGTRKDETLIVNGRVIGSRMLSSALEKGYQSLLPSRRFPLAVLGLELDPSLVDVNVHPAKAEVRFQDEREVYKAVLLAVKEALLSHDLSARIEAAEQILPKGGDHGAPGQEPGNCGYQGSFFDRRIRQSEETQGEGEKRSAGSKALTSLPGFSTRSSASDGLLEYIRERDPKLWQRLPEEVAEQITENGSGSPQLGKAFSARVFSDGASGTPIGSLLRQSPMFANVVPLGQWLNTYIVLAESEALWLIDQHIAHERVLYERLKAAYSHEAGSQPLLVPVQLELSPKQAAVLGDNLELLRQLLFTVEEFGGNSFLVRSVPLALSSRLGQEGLTQMIGEIVEYWEKGGDKLDAVITTMACRGAVKAGDYLSWSEIEGLLLDLAETENPYTCPHGRPIIVKLGLPEVERRFGRR